MSTAYAMSVFAVKSRDRVSTPFLISFGDESGSERQEIGMRQEVGIKA